MGIVKSDVVQSMAGRDQGQYFFVLEVQDEYLLLADGKLRKVEAPKRKKAKHVARIPLTDAYVAEKIRNGEKITNSELRKAIIAFSDEGNLNQEENELGKVRYDRS